MDNDLTPLGRLLESAREARRPKLSQNATAKAAGISPTTYRRVIRGIARLGGRDVAFDGTPESIARIARVLGVTPEQLEEAGRTDAAEELRALRREAMTDPHASPMDRAEAIMDENERLAQLVVERFRRLNRKKRAAVVQLLDAMEDDPSEDAEQQQ